MNTRHLINRRGYAIGCLTASGSISRPWLKNQYNRAVRRSKNKDIKEGIENG